LFNWHEIQDQTCQQSFPLAASYQRSSLLPAGRIQKKTKKKDKIFLKVKNFFNDGVFQKINHKEFFP
jgi:hypothetical protein